MTMLSAAELTTMRAVQAETFDLTAVIKRGGGATSDGAGGSTQGSATTVATVACRLGPSMVSTGETLIASSVLASNTYRLAVPTGTDLRTTDRVEVGSRTFEVMSIYGPHTFETALVALVKER